MGNEDRLVEQIGLNKAAADAVETAHDRAREIKSA